MSQRRRETLAVILLTVAFAALLALWTQLTPIFQAPDELAHFDSVLRIALGSGWAAPGHAHYLEAVLAARDQIASGAAPVVRPTLAALLAAHPGEAPAAIDQMSQHPPTYYAVAAGLLDAVGFRDLRWDIDLMVLRAFDACMLTPLPVLAWATVRRLVGSARTGLVAASSLLLVPQLPYIGSSVTNDAPLILLGALVVWYGVRVLTGDDRWRATIGLAVATALAVGTKATGYPAVLLAIVAMTVVLVRSPSGRRGGAWFRFGAAAVVVGVVGGGWWVRNLVVYHQLQPAGLVRPVLPWPPGHGPDIGAFVRREWVQVTSTFWGNLGIVAPPAGTDVRIALSVTLSVVSLALIAFFAVRRRNPAGRTPAVALIVLLLVTVVLQLGNNWQSYSATHLIAGAQGRYYFPSLLAALGLAALGASNLVHGRGAVVTGRVLVVAAASMQAYGVFIAFCGYWGARNLDITRADLAGFREQAPLGAVVPGVALVVAIAAVVAAAIGTWAAIGGGRVAPAMAGAVRLDSPAAIGPSPQTAVPDRKEPLP